MELTIRDLENIRSEQDFEALALDVFHFQYRENTVYKAFVDALGRKHPASVREIPFLPVSFFKTHRVTTRETHELEFLSSGTGNQQRSKHLVHRADLYDAVFSSIYRRFIGEPSEQVILALLPSYVEQGQSSLVHMVSGLIEQSRSELSGFLLHRPEEVAERYRMAIASGKRVLIFGVSYALLDLAELKTDLSQALIIETGGMKGRRKELSKEELHAALNAGFGTSYISSEYGMAELLSQAYSEKDGWFSVPPWLRVMIRDVNDPFSWLDAHKTGGVNIIDLANVYSCSFISTQDLGRTDGNRFQLMGRFDNSDIRGCNLLVS